MLELKDMPATPSRTRAAQLGYFEGRLPDRAATTSSWSSPAPTAAARPPWPRSSWAWSSPPPARSSGTARTSPICPSPSGRGSASATASSSLPASRACTVRRLLTLASGNDKLTKDQCCQYLTRVGLCANDYLDREVDASLSGGEVKRIEIATILARNSRAHDLRRARGRHRPVELRPTDGDLPADPRPAAGPPWSSSPTRSASSPWRTRSSWWAAARSATGARRQGEILPQILADTAGRHVPC